MPQLYLLLPLYLFYKKPKGGETKALELFKRRLELEEIAFESNNLNQNKIKPIIFNKEISLSPYLRFGCLSPRKFYWEIANVFNQVLINHFN